MLADSSKPNPDKRNTHKPQCCGKSRSSVFCPDCGRQLENDGPRSLVTYLERKADTAATRASLLDLQLGEQKAQRMISPAKAVECELQIEALKQKSERFNQWARAVLNLVTLEESLFSEIDTF